MDNERPTPELTFEMLENGLLNVDGVAKLLNTSKTTVYRLTESGQLPCFKVAGSLRFAKIHLLEYLSNRRYPQ